ncbi:MAG: hypothetical protein KTR25_05145 [Myxococcales bacterium]|nr:hypothetical protein [Myxococcales bacterium]
MDRILFGDNQFFGVNHMSEEKARAQSMKFKDTAAIMKVIDVAYSEGIKTFMCTTHDRIGEVTDIVRDNPDRYNNFTFYPGMPYAHKYANAVGELGIMGTLKKFAPGSIISTVIRGAMAGITQDAYELMKMLVDAEMQRFQGTRTPVVFLQNVVTDLLLGFNMREMFRAFHDYVQQKYEAEAGFFSMNMPMLVDVLHGEGIENPIVCSNINKIGFRMCGGIEKYIDTLKTKQFRPIAMSVYASGAIPPEEAIKWVCELPKLEAIVFGASSRRNIVGTRDLVEKYWRFDN